MNSVQLVGREMQATTPTGGPNPSTVSPLATLPKGWPTEVARFYAKHADWLPSQLGLATLLHEWIDDGVVLEDTAEAMRYVSRPDQLAKIEYKTQMLPALADRVNYNKRRRLTAEANRRQAEAQERHYAAIRARYPDEDIGNYIGADLLWRYEQDMKVDAAIRARYPDEPFDGKPPPELVERFMEAGRRDREQKAIRWEEERKSREEEWRRDAVERAGSEAKLKELTEAARRYLASQRL